MSSNHRFEKGIFSGLLIAVAGSMILPAFQIIAAVAGAAVTAAIAARNGKEGLLSGFTLGFAVVFLALINLYTASQIPVNGIMSSSMSVSPLRTTMGLFIFASGVVLTATTVTGGITGFIKYEEEFEFSTA